MALLRVWYSVNLTIIFKFTYFLVVRTYSGCPRQIFLAAHVACLIANWLRNTAQLKYPITSPKLCKSYENKTFTFTIYVLFVYSYLWLYVVGEGCCNITWFTCVYTRLSLLSTWFFWKLSSNSSTASSRHRSQVDTFRTCAIITKYRTAVIAQRWPAALSISTVRPTNDSLANWIEFGCLRNRQSLCSSYFSWRFKIE